MKVLTMPQEVEVWYVLPALRRELAFEMKKLGMTQTHIAKTLNVTKAAITQYFKKSRASQFDVSKISPEIQLAAKSLKNGNNLVKELNALLVRVRQTKLICDIHKGCCKDVDVDCGVCYND